MGLLIGILGLACFATAVSLELLGADSKAVGEAIASLFGLSGVLLYGPLTRLGIRLGRLW